MAQAVPIPASMHNVFELSDCEVKIWLAHNTIYTIFNRNLSYSYMKHFYHENRLRPLSFILLAFLLLGHFSALSAPRNVTAAPEPAWIKKLRDRTQSKIKPSDVNSGVYYLLMDTQLEVEKQEIFYHNVYKLTTEEGVQSYSELRITFDPNHEKLQLHKVVVWRNGKPINKLDLNKVKTLQRERGMEQNIFDETLTAVLVLDDVRVGDIIEYACTIKGANPVFGGKFFTSFNLQSYDPMDERLVRVVVPQNRKINYKLFRTTQKPAIETASGKTTYTWHLKDLPATAVDDDTPAWYDPYPGVYMTEFNSWQEVAKWAAPLYELEKPSKALQAKIDSIKSTVGSDEGRIVAALRFIQDEVRYLGFEAGIGGFKPRTPSEVYATRFGDCKDKALLLTTMLRAMDIKAAPALVNSNTQEHIQDLLPSPYAFNHCIVRVELIGEKVFWYDATISKQRGDHKSTYLPNYGKALVIDAGTKGLAKVVSPAFNRPQTKVKEIYYVNNFDGAVELEVRSEYSNSQADYMRSYFATTSIKDIEKDYINFYATAYPEVELINEIVFEEAADNTFIVLEKYRIENFWQAQKGQDKVVEAWFAPQVLRSYIYQPRAGKRTMPLGLGYPLWVEQTITVLLPEAWTINNEKQHIDDDAFSFRKTVEYSPSGTELNIYYTYEHKQDHVTAEATPAFLRNQKAMLDELNYGLTYNTGFTAGGGMNWLMFTFAVLAFCGACFGAYKLYYWDPQHPDGNAIYYGQSIGGWLIVVAIGLVTAPIRILVNLANASYFDVAVWNSLLDVSSISYSPALAGILVFEVVVNTAYLVFTLLLISLFFKRRTSVPRLMTVFYCLGLVFLVFEYTLMSGLNLPLGNTASTMGEAIGNFIVAAIWVPYFHLSSRVKETFVERLYPEQEEAIEQKEEVLQEVGASDY